ncbi:lantibiotic dehydratase [Streptomyces hoynatensis]|uniref:Lantibiotic dehydratase n=1 Tax=Streptomyces hoynatensis TaxID=1141874 RepID=A0A3A9ZBL7_9ACTN|nr:lantibiotic dehydratase [Streptomyces hoynatensis]RKN45711.1 lantibiotic dehydratase [Streptomyces hoynatensis]
MRDDTYDLAGPLHVRMAAVPRPPSADGHGGPGIDDIRRALADPLLHEAIELASGSLSAHLDRLAAGEELSAKRLAGIARSVSRYALRRQARPTPFGLFAGVATARIAPRTAVAVRGPGPKSVRLDAAWLAERVRGWLESPEVRRRVSVVWNNLCRTRGLRLVLPGPKGEVSVRRNALTSWAAAEAERPVPYAWLLKQAAAAFPTLAEERADALLAELIRHGFLLTSLAAPRIDAALLDHVEAAVEPLPGAAAHLRAVRAAMETYASAPPGQGLAAWRALLRTVEPKGRPEQPPVQVDLRMDAEVRLAPAVAEEARRYACAMWDLSQEWVVATHMREYHTRFLERYGTEAAVPLAELTDPHRGLGFPASYADRSPEGPARPTVLGADEEARERRALTAELVQEALLGEERELRLTPALIDRLAPSPGEVPAEPPRSLELCLQLLAESPAAVDRGDFRLLASRHLGSWVAGATAGRFADQLGIGAELARLAGGLADRDTLAAQVAFRPHTPRAMNMTQVPALLPHQLPLGTYADPAAPGHLDWRRLLVGADASGLHLTDPDSGRRVLPVVPHMVALHREAPEVARFLVDCVFGRSRAWTGWEWHGLESLPLLPRLTFGRVVVQPMRWVATGALRRAARDPAAWEGALGDWRGRYRVPDRLLVVHWDRTYGLDLADAWHRELLRQEVRRSKPLLFEDLAADGRALGWAGGHSTEVVIPLRRRARRVPPAPRVPAAAPAPSAPPVPARPSVTPARAYRLPGEDWLFAKLYAAEDTLDELLRDHLPALLRPLAPQLDRWFFIRYRDPDPHLRLRLHGEPEALRGTVLPQLTAQVRQLIDLGVLRHLVLDTYAPEVDRYGGPGAIALAEELFCADSQSALTQLGLRARGALDLPTEVLAALNHAVLLESLGGWDWCGWVTRSFPQGGEPYRRHRALVRDLLVPGRAAAVFADRFSCAPLARLWARAPGAAYGGLLLPGGRPDPAGARSILALLHMQHNRLLGIDRAHEGRGYAVLGGFARDRLGRQAAAARSAQEV